MSRVAQFGVFEAELEAGELRKQGRLVRLQQQPFEVLRALIETPGEIVTREELRRRLWSSDVVVDFDQALNKNVTKLREVLGDSATSPRFIETIPKRGYRFIAAVTTAELPAASVDSVVIRAPELPESDVPVWRPQTLIPLAIMAALVTALFSVQPRRAAVRPSIPQTAGSTRPVSTNPAAMDAYRRGQFALSRRNEPSLRSAVGLFERTMALDPGYAPAYAGAADAWSLLSSYGAEDSAIASSRARELATRALTLDSTSSEAHASLGRTAMLADWDWKTAEWHFQRALETRSDYSITHQWYAYLLSATGRHAEAEREARKAAALDPESLSAATSIGYVLYAARRFDEAKVALQLVIEVDPDFRQARKDLGLVLAAQGRHAEAIREFERVVQLSGESPVALADLAWARGLAGDLSGARRLLTEIQARRSRGYVPVDSLSLALAGAGQLDRAVAVMETGFKSKVPGLARLPVDPRWDALRIVPRVRSMAEAIRTGTSSSITRGIE